MKIIEKSFNESHTEMIEPKKIGVKDLISKINKYYHILLLTIPFILIDLITRALGSEIDFYSIIPTLVANLFTLIWIFLMLGISLSLEKKKGKVLYVIFFSISFILFLINNIYYSMTDLFFSFNLLQMANEGSTYIGDAILNCNVLVYLFGFIIILTFILCLKHFPKKEKTNKKSILYIMILFIILHSIIPLFLGKPNVELSWDTWENPRNIYMNFNDYNKSMAISGIYEYSFRDFYITFIKPKDIKNEEELAFLSEEYSKEEETYSNDYTGKYQDKNLIIIQLEGLDNWLLTEEDTPTLYKMMNNSINFTNHYSFFCGGGSTFNSEFAVNTGFTTPLSYTQNAYSFTQNLFPYSLAHLYKDKGYAVNAFHMNNNEYYSRGINYKSWGYDNYYGLQDLGTYTDDSYILDRELILNETFREKMFSEEKFVNYIITYSSHLPFTTEKGVCQKLVTEDILKEQALGELPEDFTLPEMTEEECVRRQVKETDYMVELLLKTLEEKELLDNTIIAVFTDHYLYSLSDQSILEKYKETENNLINKTPFFIWNNNQDIMEINEVTTQLNILPTLANLFGLEYHPNYYIEQDALDDNYEGYAFFSDYSWYDGELYAGGGQVTNCINIDPLLLEEKNNYINHLIKKNDLTLKYDYFRELQ